MVTLRRSPFQDVRDDLVGQVAPESGSNELFVALQLQAVLLFPVVPAFAFYAGLNPGLQQHRVERLEQVVVGAGLYALDNAVHVLAARNNDNRGSAPFRMLLDAL